MITLTKEQLINYIELLAEQVYWDVPIEISVDEDDYCTINFKNGIVTPDGTVEYLALSDYLISVFTELEQRWLASK